MTRSFFLISFLLFSHGTRAATCPLDSLERDLLRSETNNLILDTRWIIARSKPGPGRGFARSLLGQDQKFIGSLTRIEPCHGPREFEAYCDGEGRCLQLGCIEANEETMGLWWDKSPQYTDGPYHIHYLTRPKLFIRISTKDPLVNELSWSFDENLKMKKEGLKWRDFSSRLHGKGASGAQEMSWAHIKRVYPRLFSREISLQIDFDAHGEAKGLLKKGTEKMATFTNEIWIWKEGCR